MDTPQNKVPQDTEKLKEIPKWTRKYAQNRVLPVLINLLIFTSIISGIAIPSYFGGKAYQAGNMVLFRICFFVSSIAAVFAVIYSIVFSVPKWGGNFIERISQRIYGAEGNVSISEPEAMKKNKWLGYVVGMIFISCLIVYAILGSKGFFPIEYKQPISALFVVPFLVFFYCWQRPKVSPIRLLWPILYAVHAILIVIGAPILFKEDLSPWNVRLPLFGYGFLTYIIGHLYSRYALKKLKGLTHLEGEAVNGD